MTTFGHINDVAAFYSAVESSAAYAKFFNPDADARRQRLIDSHRRKRIRKPTLRSVLAQAARAGIEIAAIDITVNGVTIVPGTPTRIPNGNPEAANPANDWDVL